MSTDTLQECARERKPRFPFGFASKHDHDMHQQRQEQAVIEDAIAETQSRIDALGESHEWR